MNSAANLATEAETVLRMERGEKNGVCKIHEWTKEEKRIRAACLRP
jgi:hypothetical protein